MSVIQQVTEKPLDHLYESFLAFIDLEKSYDFSHEAYEGWCLQQWLGTAKWDMMSTIGNNSQSSTVYHTDGPSAGRVTQEKVRSFSTQSKSNKVGIF